MITLDVHERILRVEITDEEIAKRKAAWTPPQRKFERGFGQIYANHITQADKGCDFDVLMGTAVTPEPEIH